MSLKEQVIQELDRLPETQIKLVADYMSFLKFQARRHRIPTRPIQEENSLAALYAEFEAEDRELAEEGLKEYAQALAVEDVQ